MSTTGVAPSQDTRDIASSADTEGQRVQATSSSATVQPTGAPLEQASTSPSGEDGVPAEQIKKTSEVVRDGANINVVDLPPRSPTFKEQVYGYARLIRGTVLGQSDAKEQGTQVLRGEQSIPLRRGSQSSK